MHGRRERVRAPAGKKFFAPPPPLSKGRPAKNLYTKSERPTLSCRVTWVWSEMVNLHKQQYYTETQKYMQHSRALGSLPAGPW
jgi:hypothetical protein